MTRDEIIGIIRSSVGHAEKRFAAIARERTNGTARLIKGPVEARFWSRVSFPARGRGCWLWTGAISSAGYGQLWVGDRLRLAHRISYSLLVGEVPHGLDLDHVRTRGCQHRNCVNPAHLEPVTRSENLRRGRCADVARARTAAITHCPAGHPYSPENTYTKPHGGRSCKICSRVNLQRSRARRKTEVRLMDAEPENDTGAP